MQAQSPTPYQSADTEAHTSVNAKANAGTGHWGMEQTDVAIIGSGFSGLCMAIKLKQAGRHNFVILEKAGAPGGAWRDNSYPGCACDIPSYLYSYSFEPRATWSKLYAPHNEIHDYLRHCADKYDIDRHIRYDSAVTALEWCDRQGRWLVTMADRKLSARMVIGAMGALGIPAKPNIPGEDRFTGPVFHSARWDHDVDLTGKNVAVIGTGASAIQIVPAIQPTVKSVTLFQRTPPWVMPKPDEDIKPSDQAWLAKYPLLQRLIRAYIYAAAEIQALGLINPSLMRSAQKKAIDHIHQAVPDPELRAKLTPDYIMGCKRILISNDYYPALAQENARVTTDSIDCFEEQGIRTRDGSLHKVDAAVYCTGFQVGDFLSQMQVTGKNGISLETAWQDGPEAYRGVTTPDFPNLFFIVGPNSGLGHNSIVYVIERQVEYVVKCLDWMAQQGHAVIEVHKTAHQTYNQDIQRKSRKTVWESGCNSWYTTESGKNTTLWPGFSFEIGWQLRKLHKDDFHTRSVDTCGLVPHAPAPTASDPVSVPVYR